jgi:hypothetical protein
MELRFEFRALHLQNRHSTASVNTSGPFYSGYFCNGVSGIMSPQLAYNAILLISVSQVLRLGAGGMVQVVE